MKRQKIISTGLDNETIQKIKELPSYKSIYEFAQNAIINELSRQQNSDETLADMIKKVKSLDTKTTEQKVGDLELKMHIIFEEIKKQNELLKIIHSRVSIGSSFSKLILNDIKKSEELSKQKELEWGKLIDDEFDKLQLTIIRK